MGNSPLPEVRARNAAEMPMIDIFNPRQPDFPTARATGNLRKTKARFAFLILAAMLGLTLYAKLGIRGAIRRRTSRIKQRCHQRA